MQIIGGLIVTIVIIAFVIYLAYNDSKGGDK